jgi:hypothetical protein
MQKFTKFQQIRGPDLTAHTSLSPIQRGFAPSFVNYKKGCTWLAVASDKVYKLLAHCRWFSPASSTTKIGRHDIAEILLKVALKHQKSNQINQQIPHLWTSYIATFQTLQSSLISVDCFKHRFPTKWPGSTVYHRRLCRVKNMLAMYLKYHQAGLTPTLPLSLQSIFPLSKCR